MASLFDSVEFNQRLFYPRRDTTDPPPDASDRFVVVPGARLHLRQHGAVSARVTILLFHGNGEVVGDYDDAAAMFATSGAALAVVDYRGYGKSEGQPTLRHLIEDAPTVVQALGERSVIVMGRSLGSMAAAELYRAPPPGVIGFIWESGFVDLDALARRRGLALPPLSDADRRIFDPMLKLRTGRAPLLVLHGAEDALIEPLEAQVAFDTAGAAHKHLVYVPGRGHNDLSRAPLYWQSIAQFVRERLGAPSPLASA